MKHQDLNMPQGRYVAALERLRALIAGGRKLELDDCDEPGYKSTHCSWGLCAGDAESWPDAEDHLWPEQFKQWGRVAPKYLGGGQFCPMDRRAGDPGRRGEEGVARWGCYHHCRVFKADRRVPPTREEALALYDVQLERVRRRAR